MKKLNTTECGACNYIPENEIPIFFCDIECAKKYHSNSEIAMSILSSNDKEDKEYIEALNDMVEQAVELEVPLEGVLANIFNQMTLTNR